MNGRGTDAYQMESDEVDTLNERYIKMLKKGDNPKNVVSKVLKDYREAIKRESLDSIGKTLDLYNEALYRLSDEAIPKYYPREKKAAA